MSKELFEIYEIHSKKLNSKIVIPKKDFKHLNIIITTGQIWINIKHKSLLHSAIPNQEGK